MTITNAERVRLEKLGRERARIAEAEAVRIHADNRARFEEDLTRRFSYLENDLWREAFTKADAMVEPLRQMVEEEAKRLGIPRQFRPSLTAHWEDGGISLAKDVKAELRRVTFLRLDADLAEAKATIRRRLSEYNIMVLSDGFSDDARAMLEKLPTMGGLLEPIAYERAKEFLIVEKARQQTLSYGAQERFYRRHDEITAWEEPKQIGA